MDRDESRVAGVFWRLLALATFVGTVGCGAFRWLLGIPDEHGNAPPGPPDSHGFPFYQDFHFWAWAFGIGAAGYHTLVANGIPKLPTIPFTPTHRRRRERKKYPPTRPTVDPVPPNTGS